MTGKEARICIILRVENGVLFHVSSLLSFHMVSFSYPFLMNCQERLQEDISGGRKPARYCTTTSLGTGLSFCTSTCFFKAKKCFSLRAVVLTPLDLDKKTRAMLKISDKMEL